MSRIFSNPQLFQRYITFLDKLDLEDESLSIDEIKYLLFPLLCVYSWVGLQFEKGIRLYRATIYNERPSKVNQLFYPPPELTKQNRVNRQNRSIFYCSMSKATPLFECKIKKGDMFALATWITKKDITLNQVGFTNDNFTNLGSQRSLNHNIFDSKTVKDLDFNNIIENFLAKKFSENVSNDKAFKYKFTIAITERLLYWKQYRSFLSPKIAKFDGLLYPSIARNANCDNIALEKDFFDNGGLELIEVVWMKITSLKNNEYGYQILERAKSIDRNNSILWIDNQKTFDIQIFGPVKSRIEDGFQVVRDEFGKVIDRNDRLHYLSNNGN